MTTHWLILRTNTRTTIRLAADLNEAGIAAWTPTAPQAVRRPRSKAQLPDVALLPTFVFADAGCIDRLRALAHRPAQMPAFSLFRFDGACPIIADRALNPLRRSAMRALPAQHIRTFSLGTLVRIPDGCFGGMVGTVKVSNGRRSRVCFGPNLTVEIETWQLVEDGAKAA